MSAARTIVGNLDAENELLRRVRPRAPALPPALRGRLAAAATLLRVLGRDGDRLWTPEPVAPARVRDVAGLPDVEPCHGPLEPGPRLAWCASPRVLDGARRDPEPPPVGEPRVDALWAAPPPPGDVVARVVDRRFAWRLAQELGVALAGSITLTSLAALRVHLRRRGGEEPWVLKPCFSAAGRGQWHGTGLATLEDEGRARGLERVFHEQGTLVYEPRCERVADFGACAFVGARGTVAHWGEHRLVVDRLGHFLGVVAGDEASVGLREAERARLREVVEAVGRRLSREGYRGAFGIDAWRHRAGGAERFHPLGELNARLGFGLVAHLLAARVTAVRGARAVTLRFSTAARGGLPDAAGTVPLLAVGSSDDTVAWLAPSDD